MDSLDVAEAHGHCLPTRRGLEGPCPAGFAVESGEEGNCSTHHTMVRIAENLSNCNDGARNVTSASDRARDRPPRAG
jgi:hypothetical protein